MGKHLFQENLLTRFGVHGKLRRALDKEQAARKKEGTFAKGGGQGRGEEVFIRLNGEMHAALTKDGGKAIFIRNLRNRAQGKIAGREIARVDSDRVP